jgi:hypothetical protein
MGMASGWPDGFAKKWPKMLPKPFFVKANECITLTVEKVALKCGLLYLHIIKNLP